MPLDQISYRNSITISNNLSREIQKRVIKMANFCVIKMAIFFYQNGEFNLLKWQTSFSAFSQNGEFSGI